MFMQSVMTGSRGLDLRLAATMVLGLLLARPAPCQDPQPKPPSPVPAGSTAPKPDAASSESELARKAQNPIANMISFPFQNNMNFGIGETEGIQNAFLIQPVVPAALTKKINLITRVIVPIVRQPVGTDDARTGLGDINASFFLSPSEAGKVIWGAGPIVQLRTATDDYLGTGKWGAGPTAVALTMRGPWVVGLLVNNVWSFAGESSRSDVNLFTLQYFINYNLKKGWYFSSAPILTANWRADSGQQWTVPFGGGGGRTFLIGNQAFNASVQAFANAWHPEQGTIWTLRLQFTLLFPR